MSDILVIDDDPIIFRLIAQTLQPSECQWAKSAASAFEIFKQNKPDVIILDMRLPDANGLDALSSFREADSSVPIIFVTGHGTAEATISAMKRGAYDFVQKPFRLDDLRRVVRRAIDSSRLMKQPVRLGADHASRDYQAMVGSTPAMSEVFKLIGMVAKTRSTVLIRGESGTGKELVASAIYQHSDRCQLPLHVVNCAAIPESLLESELFGHEKGSFTGATQRRIGKFEQAHGATLFLDEIGEAPLELQAKLLRLLENQTFQRVGGDVTIQTDVRLIAATNRKLEESIAKGEFREDLYYRLNVLQIHLPPLRERPEDIEILAQYFLDRLSMEMSIPTPILTDGAMAELREHNWPGNVRELAHCMERALISARGFPLQATNIRRALLSPLASSSKPSSTGDVEAQLRDAARRHLDAVQGGSDAGGFVDLAEKILVIEALERTGQNQTQAAKLLGITRQTMQSKIERFGIRRPAAIHPEPVAVAVAPADHH